MICPQCDSEYRDGYLGPVQFLVRADDADEARAIVASLSLETPPDAAVELPE